MIFAIYEFFPLIQLGMKTLIKSSQIGLSFLLIGIELLIRLGIKDVIFEENSEKYKIFLINILTNKHAFFTPTLNN